MGSWEECALDSIDKTSHIMVLCFFFGFRYLMTAILILNFQFAKKKKKKKWLSWSSFLHILLFSSSNISFNFSCTRIMIVLGMGLRFS